MLDFLGSGTILFTGRVLGSTQILEIIGEDGEKNQIRLERGEQLAARIRYLPPPCAGTEAWPGAAIGPAFWRFPRGVGRSLAKMASLVLRLKETYGFRQDSPEKRGRMSDQVPHRFWYEYSGIDLGGLTLWGVVAGSPNPEDWTNEAYPHAVAPEHTEMRCTLNAAGYICEYRLTRDGRLVLENYLPLFGLPADTGWRNTGR